MLIFGLNLSSREKQQEVLQLDWAKAFLNVPAPQVVTVRGVNVKKQTRSAIVAVIIAIAARINKQDLPIYPQLGGWYQICPMLFYRVGSHK